jgi:hypothetical protein
MPVGDDPRQSSREFIEAAALARIVDRLHTQFPELDPGGIQQLVQGRYGEYDQSPVRDFVPILVERSVRLDLAHQWRSPLEPPT